MADLVGSAVIIPGSEWQPPEAVDSHGYISRHWAASAHYPAGRVEVTVTPDPAANRSKVEKYIWSLATFKTEWITSGSFAGNNPKSAARRGRAGAAMASTPAGTAAARPTSPRRRSQSQGRTRRSCASSAAAETADNDMRSPSPTPTRSRSQGRATRRQAPTSTPQAEEGQVQPPVGSSLISNTAGYGGRQGAGVQGANGNGAEPRSPNRAGGYATTSPAKPRSKTAGMVPRLTARQNALNALLMVAVGLPAVAYGVAVAYEWMPPGAPAAHSRVAQALAEGAAQPLSLAWWLAIGRYKPFLAANLVAFLNLDVLLWVLAVVTGSTWLIDPYWTFVPVMVSAFYQFHPLATADPWRSAVAVTLLWVWSIRLTHSYFRREEWQFGAREDWRFTDMRKTYGRHWWWISFFVAYLAQHVLLLGISWPMLTIHTSAEPWHPIWDTAAAVAAAAGIALAAVADTQLQAFKAENEQRKASGLDPMLINDKGVFHYSRHPNHFGEQLWWWGLSGFAVRLGQPWVLSGTFINSIVMAVVTDMVEKKMLAKPERREAFLRYQEATSVWVPWWPKRPKHHQD